MAAPSPLQRRTVMRCLIAAGALALTAASRLTPSHAQSQAPEYGKLWLETAHAVMDVVNQGLLESWTPPGSVAKLRLAGDRLERLVIDLARIAPPPDDLRRHVLLLPLHQELVAAAQTMLDGADRNDDALWLSGRQWLEDAVERLRQALRTP